MSRQTASISLGLLNILQINPFVINDFILINIDLTIRYRLEDIIEIIVYLCLEPELEQEFHLGFRTYLFLNLTHCSLLWAFPRQNPTASLEIPFSW